MNDLYNFKNDLFLKGAKWKENIWVTRDQEKKLEEFVQNGGSLFMHHDGHCYYNENGAITRLAKATHDGHPEKIEIEIYPTGDMPELTEGIEPFKVLEEEFRMEIQDSTTVFLKSHSQEHGTANQGWAHEYGKGRVVVLVPGHDTYALQHKMVRKLISNAIDYLTE
jgi:type 1 glutamine amidotransferase